MAFDLLKLQTWPYKNAIKSPNNEGRSFAQIICLCRAENIQVQKKKDKHSRNPLQKNKFVRDKVGLVLK
jgi:hypothetical protein